MMETDNPFEKVLDRLREKGWQQRGFGDEDGPNCIYGAARRLNEYNAIEAFLPGIVQEQYTDRLRGKNPPHHPVVFFNDHPDTTFTDIERVLEKATIQWEEERVLRDD